jgi:hypothetical protein
MIRLVSHSDNQLTLFSDSCTLNNTGVQFFILRFSEPYSRLIKVSDTLARDFVDNNKSTLLPLRLSNFGLDPSTDKFRDGLYLFDFFIGKGGTKTITSITERNLVNGTNILDDFKGGQSIYIEDGVYDVDLKQSTQDSLFLKTPVKGTPVNLVYNPVFKSSEFFLVATALRKQIEKKIAMIKLGNIGERELSEYTSDVVKFVSLEHAIKCGNKDEAINIYDNLKAKYIPC